MECTNTFVSASLSSCQDPKALLNLIEAEKVDVLCLQEHKLQCSHVDTALRDAGLEVRRTMPGWLPWC